MPEPNTLWPAPFLARGSCILHYWKSQAKLEGAGNFSFLLPRNITVAVKDAANRAMILCCWKRQLSTGLPCLKHRSVIIHEAGSHRSCFCLKVAVAAVLVAGSRAVLRALQRGQAALGIQKISGSWHSLVSAWFPHFPDGSASIKVFVPSSRVTRRLNMDTTCELYMLPVLSSSGKWDFRIISLHLGVLIFPGSHLRSQDMFWVSLWTSL